jgi:hypothetical protein
MRGCRYVYCWLEVFIHCNRLLLIVDSFCAKKLKEFRWHSESCVWSGLLFISSVSFDWLLWCFVQRAEFGCVEEANKRSSVNACKCARARRCDRWACSKGICTLATELLRWWVSCWWQTWRPVFATSTFPRMSLAQSGGGRTDPIFVPRLYSPYRPNSGKCSWSLE